jgi:hypothetical protein
MKEISNYSIVFSEPIHEQQDDFLKEGFFLWIMNWENIPPHLGCSWNGNYYSLSVKGVQNNTALKIQFRLLKQRKIPSFFVKISDFKENPESIFNTDSWELNHTTTCLTPLLKVIDNPNSNIERVADLLKEIQLENRILSIHLVDSPKDWCGIRDYSKETVVEYIKNLKYDQVER